MALFLSFLFFSCTFRCLKNYFFFSPHASSKTGFLFLFTFRLLLCEFFTCRSNKGTQPVFIISLNEEIELSISPPFEVMLMSSANELRLILKLSVERKSLYSSLRLLFYLKYFKPSCSLLVSICAGCRYIENNENSHLSPFICLNYLTSK